MLDVEEAAVAGVAVGDERRLRAAGDGGDAGGHVGEGRQSGVRQTEIRGDGTVAGHVQRLEAHGVGEARRDHVVDARRHDEPAFLEPLA